MQLKTGLGVVSVAAATLTASFIAPVSAAYAAPAVPIICDRGDVDITWYSHARSNVLTHAKTLENWTGGTASKTYSTTKIGTVTAGVTFSTSGKASGDIVIAKLEGTVGLDLQVSGSITNQSTESVTYTVSKNGKYVFFSGTVKVVGSFTGTACNATGTSESSIGGTATSWTTNSEGGVYCPTSVPAGSLAALAKQKYC